MEDSLEKEQEQEQSSKHGKICCNKCNFTCNQTSSWLKDVSIAKHVQTQSKEKEKKAPNICLCGKQYFDRSGLWKHTKKCMFILGPVETIELSESKNLEKQVDPQELIQVLIAENKDLKLLVLKLVQKLYM